MRILCIIYTLLVTAASLLQASTGHAQALGKRLSVTYDNTTLHHVLLDLQSRTDSDFAFMGKLGLEEIRVNGAQFKDETLRYILHTMFEGHDIVFEEKVGAIVLSRIQQPRTITGRVTDERGELLPGATVSLKSNRNVSASTDGNGQFRLTVPEDAETLVVSFMGYQAKEVSIVGISSISIQLSADSRQLEDVVVVGYGVQSRRSLTTAISSYDGRKMEGAPVNSIGDDLKGKMAGLRVATTDMQPGTNPRFLIRGGSSINQSNDPIILVDGVLRDITGLNPNDIESIEVLKDAASASIYGARASNGVILVTTKKGINQGTRITFNAQEAVQQPERKFRLMNAADYLRTLRPALAESLFPSVLNGAESAGTGNNENSIWTTRYLGEGETVPNGWQSIQDPVDPAKTIIFQDNNQQDQWFGDARWSSYHVGVEGGNGKMHYNTSAGYTDDAGIGINTGFSAFTFHGGTSFEVTQRLKATSTFDYNQTAMQDFPDNKRNSVIRGLALPYTHRDYYEDGTPALGWSNTVLPAAFYETYYDRGNTQKRSAASMKLDWNMIDGLNAVAQIANHNRHTRTSSFIKGNAISTLRETRENFSELNRLNFQAYLNYKKTFSGDHLVDLLGGYDYNYDKVNSIETAVNGAISDKVPTLNAGSQSLSGFPRSAMTNESIVSYFGRANYSFLNRYLLSLTMRSDASSKFSKDNRWGYFPAGSMAWIVSDEAFWKAESNVNFLKIRTSYGLTGNNGIGLNATFGSYATGGIYNGNPITAMGVMPNYNLRWESTSQLDIGVDVGFFDNRLQLTADYYDKVTRDLLFGITLPDITGYSSTTDNVGKVRFYGAELELSSTNIRNKDFEWNSAFTYSYNMNKVLELNNNGIPQNRINGIILGDGTQFGGIAEGERLGRFYGYKVDYIIETQEQADAAMYDALSRGFRRSDQQNSSINPSLTGRKDIGDYEWVNRPGSSTDANGNDIINAEDQFLLGYVNPHSTGGLTNTFRYKDFSLTVVLDYALGHSIYNALQMRYFMATFGNANYNLVYDVMDAWKQAGDDTKYARFTVNDPDWGNSNYSRTSDVFTQKGDFLCLRDVVLSYSLPQRAISRLGINNLTLSLSGNTLHYFTAVKGVSPEAVTSGGLYTFVDTYDAGYNPYPPARKILFGIKAGF